MSALCTVASLTSPSTNHISSPVEEVQRPSSTSFSLVLLASLPRTIAPPPGLPPERSPGEERYDPRGGRRDGGHSRRSRTDAQPAEEQSPAEEEEGVVRRPGVLRGGAAGARRRAPVRGTESR